MMRRRGKGSTQWCCEGTGGVMCGVMGSNLFVGVLLDVVVF